MESFLSNIIAALFICAMAVKNSDSRFLSTKARDYNTDDENRPIIGILAHSTPEELSKFGKSFIPASYVKFVESAGARVVPVFNDLTTDQIRKLFTALNGVLFPGGGSLFNTGYARVGETFFNLSIEAFDKGDIFPIWGTCLGFQFLNVLAAGSENQYKVLTGCDAENYPIPLNFTTGSATSKMFGDAPQDIIRSLSRLKITMNNHGGCVQTYKYDAIPELKKFFNVLSTNFDRQGKQFISTIEGKRYPFYGVQWHPEKNLFEWTREENIPHSAEAILPAQYVANFFVNQARQSRHSFPSEEEETRALIYNYKPVFTAADSKYEQCYFF